ncbi:MAG: hypothetical protein JRE40_04225 [Deltaproteobacteria bacterium]|nr:hypothetical protein [Deltaproteobacteria bacterium]
MTFQTQGRHIRGVGKAHRCSDHRDVFGCPMVGTFNVKCDDPFLEDNMSPARVSPAGRFYLVRLAERFYGYAFRWDGSKQPDKTLEIFTKRALPAEVFDGTFSVEILSPFTLKERETWMEDMYWFQSFAWGPQRADSNLIWDAVNQDQWSGATVLDIGTHYGYFAFQAAKAGAVVHGIDKPDCIDAAQTINDRIEMQDVTFDTNINGWKVDKAPFDFIFYFSVHHQFDPDYKILKATLQHLQNRVRRAVYVELLDPAPSGAVLDLKAVAPSAKVIVKKYKHNVRGTRTIFSLGGGAEA